MENKFIILPKIHRPKDLLGGRWFVYYSVLDDYSSQMKRFKIYDGFNSCKSIEAKEANARLISKRFTDKLKTGWSPFNGNDVIYQNENNIVRKKFKTGRFPKRTIEYFSKTFLNQVKMEMEKATWQKYQSELRVFERWMVINKLDVIDISYFNTNNAAEFVKYLSEKREISGKTKNNYLITLGQLWKYAAKNRPLLQNIWSKIKKFKEVTTAQRPLSQAVIMLVKTYLEKNDRQLWMAAQFMYYCFIRPKELRFLKIKNLELFEGKIMLNADISKTNKTRIVDVNLTFLNALFEKYKLNDYPPEYYVFTLKKEPGPKPVGKNYFWNHFEKVRIKMKIPRDYKFYGFKHTGAVVALRSGANIKDIQHQMGHSSVSITDEYLKSMVGYESEFFKNKMPLL